MCECMWCQLHPGPYADRGGSAKSGNGRKQLASTEEWIPPPPKDTPDGPQSLKLNINDMFENHRPV